MRGIGHTEPIKALCWNWEIPYILLTGSWDTIFETAHTTVTQSVELNKKKKREISERPSHHRSRYFTRARGASPINYLKSCFSLNKIWSIFNKFLFIFVFLINLEIIKKLCAKFLSYFSYSKKSRNSDTAWIQTVNIQYLHLNKIMLWKQAKLFKEI